MESIETLTIILPLPGNPLSPNSRPNRFTKATATRYARREAMLMARQATQGRRLMARAATTQATFWWPTRGRRDRDNASASLKAYMDGLTDAGVWVDDSVVVHLPPVMAHDPANPRVEIRITFPES